MMPDEHSTAQHHSPTGNRVLDITLALSAFVISLVSVGLAIAHGRAMERLVAANSYPNLEFEIGNRQEPDGQTVFQIALANTGVGPARLRSVELSYAGRAIRSANELVDTCCSAPGKSEPVNSVLYVSGDARGRMVRAGGKIELFKWPRPDNDLRWTELNRAASNVFARVCYCSVFDDCYIADSNRLEPAPTSHCPDAKISYSGLDYRRRPAATHSQE